jgi:hypothetical protein
MVDGTRRRDRDKPIDLLRARRNGRDNQREGVRVNI